MSKRNSAYQTICALASMTLLGGASLRAAEPVADKVQVRDEPEDPTYQLVADVAAVVPGKSFRVGVLIRMKPGFVLYRPDHFFDGSGDDLKFHLPDGFEVGETTWPLAAPDTKPARYYLGAIPPVIHRDELLIFKTVTPPNTILTKPIEIKLTGSARIDFEGNENFGGFCSFLFIDGEAETASLVLPVGDHKVAANQDIFDKYTARVPHAPPDGVEIRWEQKDGALHWQVSGLPDGKYKRLDIVRFTHSAYTFEVDNASIPVGGTAASSAVPVTLHLDDDGVALMAVPADPQDLAEAWELPESSTFTPTDE
jgi:hypothetical protein